MANSVKFEGSANFDRIKIDGEGIFDDAQFIEGSTFRNSLINGVQCINTLFGNDAVFDFSIINGATLIKDITIKNKLSIANSEIDSIYITNGDKNPSEINELDLYNTVIKHWVYINDITIGQLDANSLQVQQGARLTNVTIGRRADLLNSYFKDIMLLDVTWPTNRQIFLDHMTYNTIGAGIDENDWEKLLLLLQNSKFNITNYVQMDEYFSKSGRKDIGDKIYIDGKQKELLLKWRKPYSWVVLVLWGEIAGYGRDPIRILWLSLLLIVLGSCLFEPTLNIDDKSWLFKLISKHKRTTRIFITLDRFLPVMNLKLADNWAPKEINQLTWFYWNFLRVIGGLLMSIALAAIYTQLK